MRPSLRTLAADRAARVGALAAVPGLWLALAWLDFRLLAFAVLSGTAAALAYRAVAARRPPADDDLVL